MDIYEKLQQMRAELQHQNIKKSGKNKFISYDYYELADILPPINDLQVKYKTCSCVTFTKDLAILKIINAEKPEEVIEFTTPVAEVNVKGATPIQMLGAQTTYLRRYLYLIAFEIVENDYFDRVQGESTETPPRPYQKGGELNKPADLNLRLKLNKIVVTYAQLLNKSEDEVIKALKSKMGKDLKQLSDPERSKLYSDLTQEVNSLKLIADKQKNAPKTSETKN